ncbi:hypothetical protein FisN_9Lh166 [Fistulifera solaris]|uniref:Transportin-1 n=1 Tax=Fistulifera solaris TaxID=1519565 RepID=A0A1Z5KL10_FISSO|nr:hypothetical protein FisN_9Lh166 [Fistulifera solaris]|eukprot:GAX26877.1 hypothetical protein FisN_9Lh166 [Fistulifera solaris]
MAFRSNSGDIPPPNGQVLSLISAFSSPENHELHVQAIRALEEAFAGGSYGDLCHQLVLFLLLSDHNPPEEIFHKIAPADLEGWQRTDASSVAKLQQQPAQWVVLGQLAGFVMKNALTRPPINPQSSRPAFVPAGPLAEHLKECLLVALECQHAELRAVASSIIATCAVSADGVQPVMHVSGWPQLIPHLLAPLQNPGHHPRAFHGALDTVKKMLEDGPSDLEPRELDDLVLALMHLLRNQVQLLDESSKTAILESLLAATSMVDRSGSLQSSALTVHVEGYIQSLLALANDASAVIRQTVCRSLVTLLEVRPDLFGRELKVFQTVTQAMIERSSDTDRNVALEACEYWLTFCSLDIHENGNDTSAMKEFVQSLFPKLLIALLNNIVYGPDEQSELLQKNAMESAGTAVDSTSVKPVFHKSRAQHVVHAPDKGDDSDNDDWDDEDDDDDDDGDDTDEDGGSFWTLRKCSAASLDSLAILFGANAILPILWPALEQGLSSTEANKEWIQEACILALGAVAEGCHLELGEAQILGRLHPFLLSHLDVGNLPQLQNSAAWTLGRYVAWAVEQVQTGMQRDLLCHMTQRVLDLLVRTPHASVQVSAVTAFGVLVESAGDLMVPYLEPIFEQLVVALHKFFSRSGKVVFHRSLLLLFDTFGIIADCCGPAIAEGHLPSIYMPSLMQTWDTLASNALQDPKVNTVLMPLMEGLASIAVTSGLNYQPYALRSFDNAMCIIEMTTLSVSTLDGANEGQLFDNEVDYDPIVCSTDLLDGMVEGLRSNFADLVKSSHRYGSHFLSVVHSLCRHDVGGVRMSALALLGDLAHHTPAMLEPAWTQLLHEAVRSTDSLSQSTSVAANAVWATGEIIIRCQGNAKSLEPIVEPLIQNLLAILGDGTEGLIENAAACTGRLAIVVPDVVAPHLERFLLAGWCDAMGKVSDPDERRDAYEGFLRAIYLNSNAIHRVHGQDVISVIVSIVRCIMTWHLPPHPIGDSNEAYENQFRPFPPTEAKLGDALSQLLMNMKSSVGDETWMMVHRHLPVNARKLLREAYQL